MVGGVNSATLIPSGTIVAFLIVSIDHGVHHHYHSDYYHGYCATVPLPTLNEAAVDGAIAGDVGEVIVAVVDVIVVPGDGGDGLIVVAGHCLKRNGLDVHQGTEQGFHERRMK